MISFIVKFSFFFTISFFILGIQVGKKPLFYHISEVVDPITKETTKGFSRSVNKTLSKSTNFTKKLFTNSEPRNVQDSVSKKQSSLDKLKSRILKRKAVTDEVTASEQKNLDKLIQKH